MGRLIFWRLVQVPVLLWIIYTLTFALVWLVPGNPLEVEGRKPPKAVQEAMLAQYNLDSAPTFYVSYLRNVVKGDLGPSIKYEDWTVNQIIAGALPVSVQLGAAAIMLSLLIGVAAGVAGAVRRGRTLDWATMSIALLGISLPTFVTGTVVLMVFGLTLRWVPVGDPGDLGLRLAASFTLALPFAAYIARLTRSGMIEVLSSDFIRTARAKGLPPRKVILRHALKVAFLPVLSFLGPAAAAAMTGSFVVEKVFNIPGMGQHFVDGVLNKDVFLIMGVVLVYATMLILFNLAVDVAYHLIDPRIEL